MHIHKSIIKKLETKFYFKTPRLRSTDFAFLFIATIIALFSEAAQAQTYSCNGISETIRVTMPSSLTVPRDAAIGSVLTPWISTPAITNYYSCTVRNTGVGPTYRSLLPTASGITVNGSSGVPYQVWNTNVAGIGLAIGARAYISTRDARCSGWFAWGSLPAISSSWGYSVCSSINGSAQMNVGFQLEFALVKTGNVTPGTTSNSAVVETAWAAKPSTGSPSVQATFHKFVTLTPVNIRVAACETPDVTVNMGTHLQSKFSGVGSTTAFVPFDVRLNACPAGNLSKIQYQFDPVGAVVDANNGVIALTSNSTARGIALQLKDSNDVPLKYNTKYTLTGYSSAVGGSYKIGLKAAYRQTATAVTPGQADAVLTFTMTYL